MRYFNKVLFVPVLMIYFLLTSCDSKKKYSPKEVSSKPEAIIDSTVPPSRDSSMKKIAKLLSLGDIKDKADGEEIRIWYNDISPIGKIVVIKYNRGWQSSAYYYKAKVSDNFDVISLEKSVTSNEPSSGWDSFLKELSDLGIYELKDSKNTPGYISCSDGETVAVEIWKNNSIQRYFYPCFMIAQDTITEVKKVKNICLFIQKELGYKLLP